MKIVWLIATSLRTALVSYFKIINRWLVKYLKAAIIEGKIAFLASLIYFVLFLELHGFIFLQKHRNGNCNYDKVRWTRNVPFCRLRHKQLLNRPRLPIRDKRCLPLNLHLALCLKRDWQRKQRSGNSYKLRGELYSSLILGL